MTDQAVATFFHSGATTFASSCWLVLTGVCHLLNLLLRLLGPSIVSAAFTGIQLSCKPRLIDAASLQLQSRRSCPGTTAVTHGSSISSGPIVAAQALVSVNSASPKFLFLGLPACLRQNVNTCVQSPESQPSTYERLQKGVQQVPSLQLGRCSR